MAVGLPKVTSDTGFRGEICLDLPTLPTVHAPWLGTGPMGSCASVLPETGTLSSTW